MLPPAVLVKGTAARQLLAPAYTDNQMVDVNLRLGRYGDQRIESAWPTDHMAADEGAVMVATLAPGATAINMGISSAFSATACPFVLANSDPPGGRRIYPKWLKLGISTIPASGTDLRYAIVLDSVNRTPTTISNGTGGSGPGTPATATAYRAPVVCVNADLNPTIAGIPYFPLSASNGTPPAVPDAGAFSRTIVGNGYIKCSTSVAKDQFVLQFGAADMGGTFQAAAALAKIVENCPAVVVGPGQYLLIHLWSKSNATTSGAFDGVDLVWAER